MKVIDDPRHLEALINGGEFGPWARHHYARLLGADDMDTRVRHYCKLSAILGRRHYKLSDSLAQLLLCGCVEGEGNECGEPQDPIPF